MSEMDSTGLRKHLSVRRIIGVVGLLVLVALVLPFVIYSVPQVVGAEHSYVVLSGSMAPTIGAGDVILVDRVDPAAIQEGDIVTFRADGATRPTTHRVINVQEQGEELRFQTKGDANEDADRAPVTPNELQGRVMSIGGTPIVFPKIGHVLQFARTDIGFVGLFAIPVILFVAFEIRDILADASPDSADGSGGSEVTNEATAATDSGDNAADSDESGLTFRAAELKLGIVVLALFAAYSIWVAYVTREIWSFAVVGMVGTTLVLLLGLYLTGGEPAESTGTDSDADDSDGEAASVGDTDEVTTPQSQVEEVVAHEPVSDAAESATDMTTSPASGPAPTADGEADQSKGESDD